MRKNLLPLLLSTIGLILVGCQGNPGEGSSSSDISSTPVDSSSSSSSSSTAEAPVITAEDDGTATVRIFRSEDSALDECYIAPRNVSVNLSYQTLSGTLSNNQTVCPSIGDVNLLVIPVHLPGETNNTEQVRQDIESAFFGDENDARLGYPSLAEYYRQASFGKLNFCGEVTDWFDVAAHTSIQSTEQLSANRNAGIQEILRAAVGWAVVTQGIDLDNYDYDADGYIDGIWLVYDRMDTYSQNAIDGTADIDNTWWNMTSWDYDSYKSEEDIQEQIAWGHGTSAFSWASYSSLYTGYCEMLPNDVPDLSDYASIPVDSHTFIHETGHLLGLEDYYATDSATYRPAGQFTMMDQNVGDLDSYSKMVLGWVTPYVAYGPSQILLQGSQVNDHQVIVIPANYEEINEQVKTQLDEGYAPEEIKIEFNPFSEYIMIDLYTPDGLNALDIGTDILNARQSGPEATGVRIYHVDSRIFKCTIQETITGQQNLLFNPQDYIWDGEQLEDNQAIFMPITNAVGTGNIDVDSSLGMQLGVSFNSFDQLRLLEATQVDSFEMGQPMTEDTLFTPDTEPFSIASFAMQFFNGSYTYNGGQNLPFTVDVTTLKE